MARKSGAVWKISMELPTELLPSVKGKKNLLIGALAHSARQSWVNAARQRLHSSLRAYVNSISPVEQHGGKATIRLDSSTPDGKLANMLEEGHRSFDMKPGFLKSPNAKRTRRGQPYMNIPLRQKVPGGSVPASASMPWSVYKIAKRAPIGTPTNLPQRLANVGIRSRLSPDASRWGAYTWKTGPYQGITKTPSPTGMQYRTFRTVSRRSDPNSWIHPGFQARNVMELAASNLERMAPSIVESIIEL